MQTFNDSNQAAEQRDIPPMPGGGSWRFDDTIWKWVSNDPAPAEPAAEPAVTQPTFEE